MKHLKQIVPTYSKNEWCHYQQLLNSSPNLDQDPTKLSISILKSKKSIKNKMWCKHSTYLCFSNSKEGKYSMPQHKNQLCDRIKQTRTHVRISSKLANARQDITKKWKWKNKGIIRIKLYHNDKRNCHNVLQEKPIYDSHITQFTHKQKMDPKANTTFTTILHLHSSQLYSIYKGFINEHFRWENKMETQPSMANKRRGKV